MFMNKKLINKIKKYMKKIPFIYHLLSPIEYELEVIYKQNKNFFFIEIGANNGVLLDPIYNFIITHDCSGIVVEPVKSYFNELKENYKMKAKLIFENSAISDKAEKRDFYRFSECMKRDEPNIPGYLYGIASFYMKRLLEHRYTIPNSGKIHYKRTG